MTALTPPSASAASSRIFVSHSHADNAFCREFVRGLRTAGLEVWYDEHNLGWGELRQVIERELASSQHFIAILSPAAVASQWVNREIDAALALLGERQLTTFLLVTAAPCAVPLLLRGFKRVEGPGGSAVPASEAIESAVRILVLPARSVPMPDSKIVLPPDRFPERLATLGFVQQKGKDPKTGNEVAFIVPPTVPVPAGSFQMGTKPSNEKYRGPPRTADVAAFAIVRYPVTVAEYACFVRVGQQEPPGGWLGVDWHTQLQRLDHPVTCVTWDDATAYAAWLASLTGQPWRLPTEEEWEKAARWDPRTGASRLYPWGDTFDAARCNTAESRIGTTTPVGTYGAAGASSCGAEEMAGNVWEWTSSPYGGSTEDRVLRGGSWDSDLQYARAAYRIFVRPFVVYISYGFRLVVSEVRAGS